MKYVMILMLCITALSTYGQEVAVEFDGHKWEAPYELPVSKDWGVERFLIPIGFAPQIPYSGVEDIRFTPGWAKTKSAEYWSYAFLWYLDGEVKIDAKAIDSNLTAYYTGLIGINGREIPSEKLKPVVASFKEVKKDKGDLKTYAGTISMLDYMTQNPIVLNCKVHVRSCEGVNKTFIFYELSPQPLTHAVWISLDKLWSDFKCVK
jgi:hypothetical protein